VPARTTRTKLDFGVQPVHTEAGPAVNQQLSSEMSDYSGIALVCVYTMHVYGT